MSKIQIPSIKLDFEIKLQTAQKFRHCVIKPIVNPRS